LGRGDDPELFAVGPDHPDRRDADLLVDARTTFAVPFAPVHAVADIWWDGNLLLSENQPGKSHTRPGGGPSLPCSTRHRTPGSYWGLEWPTGWRVRAEGLAGPSSGYIDDIVSDLARQRFARRNRQVGESAFGLCSRG